MAALTIRKDRTPVMLRKLAKAEEDARVGRRMLAIANALDGMSREAAAQAAGMDRQTLRDWVIRYNENGIDGLLDRWDGGRPPRLEADELAELYAIVMAGPDPEIDGVCAFTREDLVRICEKRFDKTMHRATMGRLLRSMGLSRQAQDRKSTRLNSSHVESSYAVFCLKKKNERYHCTRAARACQDYRQLRVQLHREPY